MYAEHKAKTSPNATAQAALLRQKYTHKKEIANINAEHSKLFKILDIFVLLTNCLVFIVKFVKILYNIFMKIGIFGGTFNPPHNTHVNIARQAVAQLRFDKLLVVPCGIPPHKYCGVDKLVRLQLCNLAFAGVACSDVTEVWDYEIRKDTASYTVETLREVKRLYPDSELYLIIGG